MKLQAPSQEQMLTPFSGPSARQCVFADGQLYITYFNLRILLCVPILEFRQHYFGIFVIC